jgi:hypothetical protein
MPKDFHQLYLLNTRQLLYFRNTHRFTILGCAQRASFFANVRRQVSLAGGAGGSQKMGAKALGLLLCQQALCLSGGTSIPCSSKLLTASD